jgi:hypothetical protein
MQSRDEKGRFLRGAVKSSKAARRSPELKRTPPEPKMCREFVRRELAKSLPDVMSTLLKKVSKGDLQALKVVWQMAGLNKAEMPGAGEVARRGKNSVAALLLKRMKEREGVDNA